MLSENLQLVEAESDDLLGINVVKQIYLSACIFFLVITSFLHKQAVANDYETFSGKESLCCSVEEKAELNFTLYLRMDALFKNELFIDPGQEDFIDYIDISLGIDVYYDRFFIEANNQANRSNRGSSIGYRLVDDVDYQVDFLLGQSYLNDVILEHFAIGFLFRPNCAFCHIIFRRLFLFVPTPIQHAVRFLLLALSLRQIYHY